MLKLLLKSEKIISSKESLFRCFSTTTTLLDQNWREDNGLPINPNSFGPLTNLPDYSFKDGRPTPLGTNQKKRILYQQEIARKMVSAINELDYAKKRFANMKEEKIAEKREIIENKLKPKGHFLLKKR